jgi:MYXO-CTERM domain-containing protein
LYTGYALRTDGSIAAWGFDGYGEVTGAPTGTGFTAIAAGIDNGFALRSDGSIAAWGRNDFGQVTGIPTGTGFTAIAGGGNNGYALRSSIPPQPVPEPSTLASGAVGLLILGGMIRRRRRRR